MIGRIEQENLFDRVSNEFCLLFQDAAEESRKFFVEIDGEEIQLYLFLAHSIGDGAERTNLPVTISITDNEQNG